MATSGKYTTSKSQANPKVKQSTKSPHAKSGGRSMNNVGGKGGHRQGSGFC